MVKPKESALSNSKIAIIFFVFLAIVVGISLICKIISIIRVSHFDDSKRFTLTITNGRSTEVISLNPDPKNIVIFKLSDDVQFSEVGRLLEIPIDGAISQDSLDLSQDINALFARLVLNYKRLKTNLTIVDLLRLGMFAKTLPESSVDVRIVENMDVPDKTVKYLVTDYLIEKDKQTIQIINATNVGGLGNRLAKLVTNMGGDVIIVATGDTLEKNSTISYIDDKTYTVERLQKVLGYEVVKGENNAIADITITIGEDKLGSLPF